MSMQGPRPNRPPKRTRQKPLEPVGDPDDPRGFWFLLQRYVQWLQVHNYSEYTIRTRQVYIRTFLVWADERGLKYPTEITKQILEAFQQHLFHYRKANGQPLSWSSQSKNLIDVRMFFAYLAEENHFPFSPAASLKLPKQPQKLPQAVLSLEEVERIFAQMDTNTLIGLRDRALFETLYSTGIRRLEIVRLNVEDVDVGRRVVAVRAGKGQKDRFVPIGMRALVWIARYVKLSRERMLLNFSERALFISAHGERLNANTLTGYGRSYIDAAGIDKPGAIHLFRHSMATSMHDNGASIRAVQSLLGHANLNTTAIYTRTSLKKLLDVHGETHPAEKPAEKPAEDDNKQSPGKPSDAARGGEEVDPPSAPDPDTADPGAGDIDSWLDDE